MPSECDAPKNDTFSLYRNLSIQAEFETWPKPVITSQHCENNNFSLYTLYIMLSLYIVHHTNIASINHFQQ